MRLLDGMATYADADTSRCHMFYGQRVMDIADGLPKWSGINDKSELIEGEINQDSDANVMPADPNSLRLPTRGYSGERAQARGRGQGAV